MEYKITIFGNTVYKEIELSESMESGMVIGTTAGCQVRFNRNYFFDDFEIRVEKQEGHWTAACGENIYFQAQDALKQYFLRLEHGTKLSVNYEKTGSAVFELEFMIDYERRVQSFDCRVDISGVQQLMIGGNAGCSIRVSELTGGECVRLTDCGTYYCLEDLGGGYGMCVNGFRTKEKSAALYDKDFFSVSGVSFFLRKEVCTRPGRIIWTRSFRSIRKMWGTMRSHIRNLRGMRDTGISFRRSRWKCSPRKIRDRSPRKIF